MLNDLPNDLIVFLDQAYFEYIEDEQYKLPFDLIDKYQNLIISGVFQRLTVLRLIDLVTASHLKKLQII